MTENEAPASGGSRQHGAASLALLALLVFAVHPYLYAVALWPGSRDAAEWIVRGAPESPAWAQWVFATHHFDVGYRPLAALSYSAVHAMGGFWAPPQRGLDLALHLACIALVFAVFRRLAPQRPVWGGLVAAAVFAGHPLAEEVVPHLARRSYSLSTALGLGALVVLLRPGSVRPLTLRRSGVAGLLLAGAVLSNETALVGVAAAAALLLGAGARIGPAPWNRMAALLAPVAAALVLRIFVVWGVGGYEPEFDRVGRALPIAHATWRTLAGRLGPADGDGSLWLACAGIVTLYYAWRAGWHPVRRLGRPEDRMVAWLFAWVLAFVALFAALGVWFPRQMYPVLVPFSLLVGIVFADSLRPPRAGAKVWLHGTPQVLLLASLLAVSPLVRGSDRQRMASAKGTDAVLRDLHQQATGVKGRLAGLVVPHYRYPEVHALRARDRQGLAPRGSLLAEVWVQPQLRGSDLRLQTLVVFEEGEGAPDARPVLVESGGLPAVEFDGDQELHPIRSGVRVRGEGRSQRVEILTGSPLDGPGAFLYVHDGDRGRMISLHNSSS